MITPALLRTISMFYFARGSCEVRGRPCLSDPRATLITLDAFSGTFNRRAEEAGKKSDTRTFFGLCPRYPSAIHVFGVRLWIPAWFTYCPNCGLSFDTELDSPPGSNQSLQLTRWPPY